MFVENMGCMMINVFIVLFSPFTTPNSPAPDSLLTLIALLHSILSCLYLFLATICVFSFICVLLFCVFSVKCLDEMFLKGAYK